MICARRDVSPFGYPESGVELYLTGTLSVPRTAVGLVVVAQAAGRAEPSRFQQVAAEIIGSLGLGTCLVDLLDSREATDEAKRNDVDLLTERLERVIDFLSSGPQTWHLPVAVLSDGKASAAALTLASERPEMIQTVVSCCGRPDLSMSPASRIEVPVLLVTPAQDSHLLACNEEFFLQLRCVSQLAIVRVPTTRRVESQALAASQQVIRQWCRQHMVRPGSLRPNRHPHDRDAKTGTGE